MKLFRLDVGKNRFVHYRILLVEAVNMDMIPIRESNKSAVSYKR